jgi:hypothetical protein
LSRLLILMFLSLTACREEDPGPGSMQQANTHAICDAYVACVGQTTPAGLAAILAAYGSEGACWTSTAQNVCLDACRTGLQQTRKAFPAETSCPECLSDGDCGGRACDTSAGKCVDCTSNQHCGGATPACASQKCVECAATSDCASGVCDRYTNRCTACVSDQDCSGATPHCLKRDNQPSRCAACARNSDCPSNSCDDGACCVPETCDEIAKYWSISVGEVCGSTYSIRCNNATVYCDACSRGSCDTGFNPPMCTLEGTACTPGLSGACLPDEVCAYYPTKKQYECAKDIRGSECVYGGDSYKCNDYRFNCDGANLVNDGVCRAHCLNQTDCRANEKCSIYPELGYGICYPT